MEEDPKPGTSGNKQGSETVAEQWKRYMDTKKAKLMHQINYMVEKKVVSNIFDGVSIFVNGYTNPPASELRHLIQLHGGEYHVYYEYGRTTYTVATHIAKAKSKQLRRNEKIIHPQWITDCIKAAHRLPDVDYLLPKDGAMPRAVMATTRGSRTRNAATDPNYIDNFYGRSRLHLISTLAQEMRRFVLDLRRFPPEKFISRSLLFSLSDPGFTDPPKECICHIDLDCFFVSVALRSRPDLIGKPVAVTHSRGTDYGAGLSDIASCSYEARAFGVRNGMPVRTAKKLCSNIICVPYQFEDYRATSKQIYQIVSRYTIDIRAVSCDEMYIDLESLCKDIKVMDVMKIVSVIRDEIFRETGCPASVGIGSNMLLARLATRHAKPNGQFSVKDENVQDFMKKEKISFLPSIGYSTRAKLKESFGELETCEELQKIPMEKLQALFGSKLGRQIYNLSRGIDKNRDLLEVTARKSVSCDVNYGIRFTKESELFEFLKKLADQLEKKMIAASLTASTVNLRLLIRSPNAPMEPEKFMGCGECDVITRSSHLVSKPIANATVIFEEAKKLAKSINPVISDLRGIGLQLTHLKEETPAFLPKQQPHTLADFFKVQGAPRKRIKKGVIPDDDLLFKKAVRESIRDEAERRLKVFERMQVCPKYHHSVDDFEIKAQMLDVLSREPVEKEMNDLTDYFYQLTQYEDFFTIVSQLRFLDRKAFERSGQWAVFITTLKMFVKEICFARFGSELFV